MASTFYSVEVARGDVPRAVTPGVYSVFGTYELAAALVINDVVQMVKVPLGARVLSVTLFTDDLDTNTTPAIVLDVGDDGVTDRFIDGAICGQAGGMAFSLEGSYKNAAGFGYTYTANNTIDVLVQVAPATGAATGTISVIVMLSIDN